MKIGDAPTVWVSHKKLEKYLKSINWKNYAVLCHNTAFDGFILSHLFGIVPAFYLDTLSMSRAVFGAHVKHDLNSVAQRLGLGAKIKEALESTKGVAELSPKLEAELGGYCVQDVELTWQAFWGMYDYIPDDELELIDMTMRMFCDPVLEIDCARVQRELEKEVGGKVAALMRSGVAAADLVSNKKFAALLEAAGVKPPMKISPATGKPTYAFAKTDLGFQALGECGNPKVEALYEARLKIKSSIGETRAIRFLEAGKDGMKLPVLLNYCGAHTTRWSGGNKINLQNLVRGGELRKSIVAPPGYVIVVADSAQIEARMTAWLAGQEDLIEAFRNKRDIYSEFATGVFNRPIDRKRTELNSLGEIIYPDFVPGFVGKVCLAEGSMIYSDRGWIPIETLQLTDKLWDGDNWVCHSGLAMNGTKETLNLCGLWLTKDHLVWSGTQWLEAQYLEQEPKVLSQALATAAASLPSRDTYAESAAAYQALSSNATAMAKNTPSTSRILSKRSATGAGYVRETLGLEKDIGSISTQWPTTSIGLGYSTGYLPQSPDAITLKIKTTPHMDSAVSLSAKTGEMIVRPFSNTFKLLKGGMTRFSRWIAQITTKGMNLGTSASSLEKRIITTNGNSTTSRKKSVVYDVLSVGPKNRFLALTDQGPLIVHNCVLGLGYGMGAVKLQSTLEQGGMGAKVILDRKTCELAVRLYRQRNQDITALWAKLDSILIDMAEGNEVVLGPLRFNKDCIQLPNGLFMQYPDLDGTIVETWAGAKLADASYRSRYGKNKIYGGLLTENVVQALARCAVAEQMLTVSRAGYRVVTMTHDEIVCVVPEPQAQECLDFMLKTMSTAPDWAPDLPLFAEGGFDRTYSK